MLAEVWLAGGVNGASNYKDNSGWTSVAMARLCRLTGHFSFLSADSIDQSVWTNLLDSAQADCGKRFLAIWRNTMNGCRNIPTGTSLQITSTKVLHKDNILYKPHTCDMYIRLFVDSVFQTRYTKINQYTIQYLFQRRFW